MQVVIDTNIIVSALLSPNGNAYVFMNSVFGGLYDVIVTHEILCEYYASIIADKTDVPFYSRKMYKFQTCYW